VEPVFSTLTAIVLPPELRTATGYALLATMTTPVTACIAILEVAATGNEKVIPLPFVVVVPTVKNRFQIIVLPI
jgi:hypothetical protein